MLTFRRLKKRPRLGLGHKGEPTVNHINLNQVEQSRPEGDRREHSQAQ